MRSSDLLIAVLLTWGTASAAQAQRPLRNAPFDTVDVSLSLSGGVSYGSYQAGVNHAILDFMRRANDGNFDDLIGWRPLRYRLRATAGASAGNINAFLSALAWCAPQAQSPSESIFWNVWVPTGIEQLLPENALEGDFSIFNREYFDKHFALIREALNLRPSDSCQSPLPIGITLTRQDPDSLLVRQGLSIPVQRFATVFALRPAPNRTSQEFITYDNAFGRDGTAGMVMRFAGNPDDALPVSMVTDAIVASSAFPAAFAPMKLVYSRVNDPVMPLDSAFFFDGGLFDNNPLALLFDLQEDLGRTDPSMAQDTVLIYIDPGRRRSRLEDDAPARNLMAADSLGPHFGLDMLYHLARTAVQPARKYELHALARDIAVDTAKKEMLRITSRGPPAFGSTLGAFGAFLGRPLREYDFIAGVYDGLLFALEEWLCAAPEPDEYRKADLKTTECTDARRGELQVTLLDRYRNRGWVSATTATIMTRLLEDDAGEYDPRSRLAEGGDGAKYQLERSGYESAPALDSVLLQVVTEAAYIMEGADGGSGLDSALVHIGRSVDRGRLNEAVRDCPRRLALEHHELNCVVDRTFLSLLDSPEDALANIQRQVVRRLWRIADFVGDCQRDPSGPRCDEVLPVTGGIDSATWERLMEVAEWIDARASSGHGLSWNPNTVPEWRSTGTRVFGEVVPSWFTFHVNDNGWNLQSSYPLFVELKRPWSLVFPVGGSVWSRGSDLENVYSLQAGAGLAWKGLRAGYTFVDRQPDRIFAFWDVFGLALGADMSTGSGRETRLMLGLSDVPGLIYALRFIN